jgi:hypothetical protein
MAEIEDEFEFEFDWGRKRDQGKKNTRDNPDGLLWRFLFVQVS